MKKWTVMLIPHDRGSTRTLTISNLHFGVGMGLLAVLAFVSAFFFQRNLIISHESKNLREMIVQLELEKAKLAEQPEPAAAASALSDSELRAAEARLRAQYEARYQKITVELNALLDLEAKTREMTGIPARETKVEQLVASKKEKSGGKGGGMGNGPVAAIARMNDTILPPHIINGMTRPSPDLILQEIQVRVKSMGRLVTDMEARQDEVLRTPSIWPIKLRKITSRFGFRRDPFNRRIRHHDGTDISAPVGTPVCVTAKGVVKESTYDGDYGNIVKVDHGNGLETWYAHLSARGVRKGQKLERGDTVGKVGSTGRSTGPHLHYEVHRSGKTVDAEVYLD